MVNLVLKDFRLGVNPLFLIFPLLTGALMLVPGWLYLLVPLYFCWITIPNLFAGFRSQNDVVFTALLPVARKDMVKARVAVIVLLELLHMVIAMIYGMITLRLYPQMNYYFFAPHPGFWGLCFIMLGAFNLIFIGMYYKTASKYGGATTAAIASAMLFAGAAQWAAIQSPFLHGIFYGSGADHLVLQASILIAGIVIFLALTLIAYRIGVIRFLKLEL